MPKLLISVECVPLWHREQSRSPFRFATRRRARGGDLIKAIKLSEEVAGEREARARVTATVIENRNYERAIRE